LLILHAEVVLFDFYVRCVKEAEQIRLNVHRGPGPARLMRPSWVGVSASQGLAP